MSNTRMDLSRSQSLRVAAVLEDFQNQLDILTHTFTVELDNNPHSPQDAVTLHELIQDCYIISDHMRTLRVELEEKQTFKSLVKKIDDEEQRKQMVAEHIRNVTKAEFREKVEFCNKQEEELKNKRVILKEIHEELKLQENQEHEHWEKTQNIRNDKEDKLLMLQKEASEKEKMLEHQIKLVQQQIEKEHRFHKESIKFLQTQQEEKKRLRDQWEDRRGMARQDKAEQLNNVSCKITLSLDRLMEMRRKFRVMEQVVMEDKEEQEILRQRQEQIKAATKLQAWWRGCMVRKGLGIYKKTEEDKKGKKKDGKKDGKKNGKKEGKKKKK